MDLVVEIQPAGRVRGVVSTNGEPARNLLVYLQERRCGGLLMLAGSIVLASAMVLASPVIAPIVFVVFVGSRLFVLDHEPIFMRCSYGWR